MLKILSCYSSGANVLVSAADGKSIYTIARENGYANLAKSLQETQIKEWRKDGSRFEAQYLYDAIEPKIVNRKNGIYDLK